MAARSTVPMICLLLASLLGGSGCAGKNKKWQFTDWRPRAPWSKKDEKPDPQVPSRLVATWVETTLHKQGETPKRGFGGRIVFFDKEGQDPVRVEGQLVVYAFDETDRPPHETQPTRRFIFPKEQFALHESESKIGTSYSVWLPWDEVGGPMKKISLITRFEPEGGPVILGEQTRHLLPGFREQQYAAPTPPAQQVQLAGFNQPTVAQTDSTGTTPSGGQSAAHAAQATSAAAQPSVANPNTPLAQMSTLTIPLPRRVNPPPARSQQPMRFPQPAPGVTAPDERAAVAIPAGDARTDAAPQHAPIAPPHQAATPRRPQAQSLRNSLLSTLPARVVPAAQPAHAGVR